MRRHPGRSSHGHRRSPVAVLAICLALLVPGCHSRGSKPVSITFTSVPPAGRGGRTPMATIAGHIDGAKPGQQIVVYAQTDSWWVQPSHAKPYTAIQPDGTWSALIHLGHTYAALLVDSQYRPIGQIPNLPLIGSGVVAVAHVDGVGSPVPPLAPHPAPIHFSGYDWAVRNISSNRGGIEHPYLPGNVSVDPQGALHLRIARGTNEWTCSEVVLTRSLGYGTYIFRVRDITHLEPAADVNLFTWFEGPGTDRHELDIDLGKRGNPAWMNAEYVVQPYYVANNVTRFATPAGPVSYSFDWEPDRATFSAWRGDGRPTPANHVYDRVFTSSIPPPGGEAVRINFCPFGYPMVPLQNESEVVLEQFQYLP